MRKLLFLSLGVAFMLTQSCNKSKLEKEATVVKQTIDAAINANESYTFVLPDNTSDDPFEITTQATHFSISELGKNADGAVIYQYTPETDFVGTDVVVVANVEEEHGDCGNGPKGDRPKLLGFLHPHPKHGKPHHEEVLQEITINLTVTPKGVGKIVEASTK